MSHRFRDSFDATDFPKRQTVARERQPAIALLILGLFAGGTATCAALIAPILWTGVTDAFQPAWLTYQQCGTVQEDTSRLAYYDRLLRQKRQQIPVTFLETVRAVQVPYSAFMRSSTVPSRIHMRS